MSLKKSLKIVLFLNLIFQVILDNDEIDYQKKYTIKDMETRFLSSKQDKFYFLGELIQENHNIIAFTDYNSDKLTDIITYKKNGREFSFYVHDYIKEPGPSFNNPDNPKFTITTDSEADFRNLNVFDYEEKLCFLISFNNLSEKKKLLHYIKCGDDREVKLNIKSNILILYKVDSDLNQLRILYYDYDYSKDEKRRICKLNKNKDGFCEIEEFQNWLDGSCEGTEASKGQKYLKENISLEGGLAFVDIDGDCLPDIILSHEDENNKRYIEIYKSNRKNLNKFCLNQTIELDNTSKYGAFAITKINDDRTENYREKEAPLFDILVPLIDKNQIMIIKNKKKIKYGWSNNYCEDDYNNVEKYEYIFEKQEPKALSIPGYEGAKIDSNCITSIRVGDFLGTSNPGLLITFKDASNNSIVALFKREEGEFIFYAVIDIKKIPDHLEGDQFKMSLFFDIDETGTLSLILPTIKGKNYFFFNYKRNIYFIKSKLTNSQTKLYNSNIGASFRYIVTDKNGNRHMDVWHQLSQTSDMNIPLPYSLVGLDDTNNYVEYFQSISGNYLEKEPKVKGEKNWKVNSPIIPNTQMMISKFMTKDKIEWLVDLIVQPMDQILLFLIIFAAALIIILGIIIYLHIKEIKEEEKETNKFKSWFA
jgi:hypothetical protein